MESLKFVGANFHGLLIYRVEGGRNFVYSITPMKGDMTL